MRAGGAPLDALQHRAALVRQLRTLQQNHDTLLGALQRKLEAQMAQGAARAGQATAGGKRYLPPSFPEGPEGKRQRLEHERGERIKAIWGDVNKILDRLKKNTKAQPFLHPVDPVKLNIPDYFTLVKRPMDLGTVKRKLSTNKYASPLEVLADVRQVFINCRIYNPAHTPVAKQGEALSEMFERGWGQLDVENRWALELKRKEREDQMLANGADDAADDTPARMEDMRHQLSSYIAAADQKQGSAPAANTAGAGAGGLRPMSFEEKRKLSAHLSSLPGEKVPRVIEILHEARMVDADADADQEVELDVDQLSPATLWALRKYVDSVLQPRGPPPKKPNSGQKRPPPSKQAPGAGAGSAGAGLAGHGGTGNGAGAGAGAGTGADARMQPPAARAPAGGGNGAAASPQRSEEANSGGGVVESSGRALEQRGVFGLHDAGTVAQSGIHNNPSSAFLKSQRKAPDVKPELDMAAWANVGVKADDDQAAAGTAGAGKAGDEGEGDAVWADFAQKAAQEEQRKEQAAEAEAQRKQEEERRKREVEEQKRQAEQQKELARQAAIDAKRQAEQDALRDMQANARFIEDPSDMVHEIKQLQMGNGGSGHMLGLAAVDEDSDGGFADDSE